MTMKESVTTKTSASASSTIIETSLLGRISTTKETICTLSTTVSTTATMAKDPLGVNPGGRTTTTARPEAAKTDVDEATESAFVQTAAGSRLSPRLEMRLALNHNIMGDEDLISYEPGPNLTTILG